jgi:hypothetical protein
MQRIEHVQLAMPAGEEDAARRFYAQALGMTEVPKPEELAKRGGCWFEDGDVRVHLGVQNDFRPPTGHILHSWWTICKLLRPGCVLQDFPAKMTSLLKASIELMFTTPSATGLN